MGELNKKYDIYYSDRNGNRCTVDKLVKDILFESSAIVISTLGFWRCPNCRKLRHGYRMRCKCGQAIGIIDRKNIRQEKISVTVERREQGW